MYVYNSSTIYAAIIVEYKKTNFFVVVWCRPFRLQLVRSYVRTKM